MKDSVEPRAVNSDLLSGRIAINARCQSLDFNAWVFEGIGIPPGARVLELCCGTGKQTAEFLKRIGPDGVVTAIDASKASLEKIETGIAPEHRRRLRLIHGDMDELARGVHSDLDGNFDIVFCSYGLYYSKSTAALLDNLKRLLSKSGKLVIVGPFGANNDALYDLVSRAGGAIEPNILHSSRTYMYQEVLPWAAVNCQRIMVRTATNDVVWDRPEDVVSYWKNTTFYDARIEGRLTRALQEVFRTEGSFINRKWIMAICAENVR